MAAKGALGTTLGIVKAAPATFNEAGYEALTFVEAEEVVNIGEFGREVQRRSGRQSLRRRDPEVQGVLRQRQRDGRGAV